MASLFTIQAAVALVGLPVAAAWPAPSGPLLLVSLSADGRLAARAVDAGARLLGPGPVPGSLLVDGERARLRAIPGTLVLAGRADPCGNTM